MNKAKRMLNIAEKYNNSEDMLYDIYGISKDEYFDAYIIAPSWTPNKILKNVDAEIKCITRHAYFSSYKVTYKNVSLAWIQCAAGAGNLIDTVLCLSDSKVQKVIFIGAVGALQENIMLGELATPLESYAYEGGSLYLSDEIRNDSFGKVIKPHNDVFIKRVIEIAKLNSINIKQRKVFCTDSILCEYSHLDYIKSTGAELIEMETASFYRCMNLMRKDGIALLCVSDNSASGISLVAKSEEETRIFHEAREVSIPKLIELVCEL